MQYENNLRKKLFYREREKKKNKIWFSKSRFPKGTSGKKGGRLIIRVILYSGQYGTNQKLSFDIFTVGNLQNIFMEHDLYLIS